MPTQSVSDQAAPTPAAGAVANSYAPVDAFIHDILEVSNTVAPELAEILGASGVQPGRQPWVGDRSRGLELCLRMMRYARVEVVKGDDGDRLDLGIAHVESELARLTNR